MPSFFHRLQNQYDKEIRECCDEKQKNLINCLNENSNDEFICLYEINLFKKCIQDYSNNFTNKYSKLTNFKIYY